MPQKTDIKSLKLGLRLGMMSFFAILLTAVGLSLYFYGAMKSLNDAVNKGQAVLIKLDDAEVLVGNGLNAVNEEFLESAQPPIEPKEAEKLEELSVSEGSEKVTDELDIASAATNNVTQKGSKWRAPPVSPENCLKPRIAIVVLNLGLSKNATEEAMALPKNITLGFVPYTNNITAIVEQAVLKGFEVLLNIPMQPENYPMNDPGPYALLNNLSTEENLLRFHWVISQSKKIVGLYTSENEVYTHQADRILPILSIMKEEGLLLLYTGEEKKTEMQKINQNIGTELMSITLDLDQQVTPDAIKQSLKKLEEIARGNGYAIGVMHAYPVTLNILKTWIDSMQDSGIALVPISNIYDLVAKSQKVS